MIRLGKVVACATCCVAVLAGSVTGAAPDAAAPCADPLAVVERLYDSNDASQFDASLELFEEDASLVMWAEGINGHRVARRDFSGKEQIRRALGAPGLRRTSDRPDGLRYRETKTKVTGNRVTFMLEPDRLRPNGKPYGPFRVEAVLLGCRIKTLTVIEYVTWL